MSRHEPPSTAGVSRQVAILGKHAAEIAELWNRIGKLQPVELATYVNSWRNYEGGSSPWSPAKLIMDLSGIVRVEGLVDRAGGNFAEENTIAEVNIPMAGDASIYIAACSGGGIQGYCQVRVQPSGEKTLIKIGGFGGPANPVNWVALNTIWWRSR
jgi:hypothetical protein